jgi:acetyltransferase
MSTTAFAPASATFAARVLRLKDGRAVAVRAARPDDAPAVQRFVRELSARSLRNRFFAALRELSPDQLDRLTRPRDPRELALVAEMTEGTQTRVVALAQHALSEPPNAEFAVVVDDSCQRQGLGTRLIAALADHATRARLAAFVGFVLADNWPMLALLTRLGFELEDDGDPRLIRAVKPLDGREMRG